MTEPTRPEETPTTQKKSEEPTFSKSTGPQPYHHSAHHQCCRHHWHVHKLNKAKARRLAEYWMSGRHPMFSCPCGSKGKVSMGCTAIPSKMSHTSKSLEIMAQNPSLAGMLMTMDDVVLLQAPSITGTN